MTSPSIGRTKQDHTLSLRHARLLVKLDITGIDSINDLVTRLLLIILTPPLDRELGDRPARGALDMVMQVSGRVPQIDLRVDVEQLQAIHLVAKSVLPRRRQDGKSEFLEDDLVLLGGFLEDLGLDLGWHPQLGMVLDPAGGQDNMVLVFDELNGFGKEGLLCFAEVGAEEVDV